MSLLHWWYFEFFWTGRIGLSEGIRERDCCFTDSVTCSPQHYCPVVLAVLADRNLSVCCFCSLIVVFEDLKDDSASSNCCLPNAVAILSAVILPNSSTTSSVIMSFTHYQWLAIYSWLHTYLLSPQDTNTHKNSQFWEKHMGNL